VPEKPWSTLDLATRHRHVAIDANLLIYLIDRAEPWASLAAAVLDAIEARRLTASMATVGQVEVLTGPARTGDASAFEQAADELRSLGVALEPLSSAIAEDAAWLRGQGGLSFADAIHVATARAAGATALITNDRRIQARPGLDVLYLDDLVQEPSPA
jgi:predicted nucleic acid-binding protein